MTSAAHRHYLHTCQGAYSSTVNPTHLTRDCGSDTALGYPDHHREEWQTLAMELGIKRKTPPDNCSWFCSACDNFGVQNSQNEASERNHWRDKYFMSCNKWFYLILLFLSSLMDLLFLHQTFPFLPLFVYPLVHHYECYEFPKVQKIEGFLKYRLRGTDWLDKKMLKSKSAKCKSMVQKKGKW